jgi:hypothetical protein
MTNLPQPHSPKEIVSPDAKSSTWVQIGIWMHRKWLTLFEIAAWVLLAMWQVPCYFFGQCFGSYLATLLLMGTGIWLFVVVINKKSQREDYFFRLEAEHKDLRAKLEKMIMVRKEIFDAHSVQIFTHHKFSHAERVTIYGHQQGVFVLLGRFSLTPKYNAVGRPFYPEDQGVIARAWQSGEAHAELPDPEQNWDRYLTISETEWNLPRDVIEKMGMRSCSYTAFPIYDHKGTTRIGVIVFESTVPNVFDEKQRKRLGGAVKRANKKYLANEMEATKPFWPTANVEELVA